MTPKEKAKSLVSKYYNFVYLELDYEQAKQCAIIAVDEILKLDNPNTYNYLTENKEHLIVQFADSYWQEVKQEIEKL
jgi:hypothetical protein